MDLAVIRYVVLVVAALILIWTILEMRWRLLRKSRTRRVGTWIDFETSTAYPADERPLAIEDEDAAAPDAEARQDLHARAQQNGHYSRSKKTL